MLTLHNSELEVTLEPSYGAQIISIARPNSGSNALAHYDWATPARARDGQRYNDNTQEWLSNYRGGWQELFPNSGEASVARDTVTPFHGEVSTASWDIVENSPVSCTLQVATRLPLMLTRTMTLCPDSPCLLVEEQVDNLADFAVDCVWAHHPVFPALPGTRIDLPSCEVAVEPVDHDGLSSYGGRWPALQSHDGNDIDLSKITHGTRHRLTYHHCLPEGWAALRPPNGSLQPGVALAWDLETWPYLWMWMLAGTSEFPWYGRARLVGLEPNRAWPSDGLAGAVNRNQQLTIKGGMSHHAWVTFRLLEDTSPVWGVTQDGALRRS